MTPVGHPFIAGAGLTAREIGFNQNAWGVAAGLVLFLACITHERLSRR